MDGGSGGPRAELVRNERFLARNTIYCISQQKSFLSASVIRGIQCCRNTYSSPDPMPTVQVYYKMLSRAGVDNKKFWATHWQSKYQSLQLTFFRHYFMANHRRLSVYFVDLVVNGYHKHSHKLSLWKDVVKDLLKDTYFLFLKNSSCSTCIFALFSSLC